MQTLTITAIPPATAAPQANDPASEITALMAQLYLIMEAAGQGQDIDPCDISKLIKEIEKVEKQVKNSNPNAYAQLQLAVTALKTVRDDINNGDPDSDFAKLLGDAYIDLANAKTDLANAKTVL